MAVGVAQACLLAVFLLTLTGCAAFRVSVKDKAPVGDQRLTAKYDQEDLLVLAQRMSQELLAAPFPPAGEEKPIVVEMGVQNRTKSHLDMKALTDTMTTKLLDTGKLRFVDSSLRDNLLKEQGYQLANCTPETRAKIGKQLGAKYMLTGSLTEIETQSGRQVRVSKQQNVYYQLTAELTDIETGLLVVRKQIDRMREASKPLIGW
jgi:uncharacterized protein (TIGR02722 family)